jgi:hypothetical protein
MFAVHSVARTDLMDKLSNWCVSNIVGVLSTKWDNRCDDTEGYALIIPTHEKDRGTILASEKTAGCILPMSLNVLSPC